MNSEGTSQRPEIMFMAQFQWSLVENAIMIDGLDISDLNNEQVVNRSIELHLSYASGMEHSPENRNQILEAIQDDEILFSSSHEGDLKEEAEVFVFREKYDLAILLYATWLEHWANRIIQLRCTALSMPTGVVAELLRANLMTKLKKIWPSLGLPELQRDTITEIARITEVRNGFAHYKWPHAAEGAHDKMIKSKKEAASRAKNLVEILIDFENRTFYLGRREGIFLACVMSVMKYDREWGIFRREK